MFYFFKHFFFYLTLFFSYSILSQIIVKFNETKIFGLFCDMKLMTEKKYEPKIFSEKDCLAVFNMLCKEKKLAKNMNMTHKFVFFKITQLRDSIARKLDLETKKIVTDEELFDFCFQENLV